jgi:hypothetical protein
MGAKPEGVTSIVRLIAEGGGRVAGIVERVRSGEKRRFRDVGPIVATVLRGGI